MPMNPGANQYRQTSIKTATRGQILIMLYEGALQNVKKAIYCIEKDDRAGKGKAIVKAHDIINELSNTLDHKVGGDIARQLDSLYTFIVQQLVKANLENTKEPLLGAQKVLENLLEGWRVAVTQVEKGAKQGG